MVCATLCPVGRLKRYPRSRFRWARNLRISLMALLAGLASSCISELVPLLTICLSGGTSRVSIFRAKWIGSELPLSVNRSHSITQLKGRVGPWPPNGFGVLLSYHPGAGSHCR
jgi:hypothetical protein